MNKSISEFIQERRESRPESSLEQIKEFEKTSIYRDLIKEWELWIDDLRNLYEEKGNSSEVSPEFYRGAISILKQVLVTTEDLKNQFNQEMFNN